MESNYSNIQDSYICLSAFKGCQFKILRKNIIYCRFFNSFVELSKSFKIEALKICPGLKDKLLYHDYLADKIQVRSKKFLEKVKIGEIVYCTTEMKDVIFLARPEKKYGLCRYRTFDAKDKEAGAHCFRKISLGSKCAEYNTTKIDDLNACEILAREYGFRVEKITLTNSHLLKICGDIQEDVDQFVISLNNNYFLD